MISVQSVLSALVLFSALSSHLAMPATQAEDAVAEPDGLFLGAEPMAESAVGPLAYRRGLALDAKDGENGSPRIIIVSDVGLKGLSVRGLRSAFTRSLPPLTDPEHSLKNYRRNTDLDMLRCMIGRVYRPCWEI